MLAPFHDEHWTDPDGNPTGGISTGTGIDIVWQDGPLGRGSNRKEPNGAFVETVLAMAKSRLAFYETANGGKFACVENQEAIYHIEMALAILDARTKAREARNVEGMHVA